MDDEYSTVVTLEDEDGNTFELEEVLTIEDEETGYEYGYYLPPETEEDNPDYGAVILKIEYEGDETILSSIEDPEEENRIYEKFMSILLEEDEGDDPEAEEGSEP